MTEEKSETETVNDVAMEKLEEAISVILESKKLSDIDKFFCFGMMKSVVEAAQFKVAPQRGQEAG